MFIAASRVTLTPLGSPVDRHGHAGRAARFGSCLSLGPATSAISASNNACITPSRRPRSSPTAPLAPRGYRSASERSPPADQIRQHHGMGRVSNANSRYGFNGGLFLGGCSWSFTRRLAIRQASGEGSPPQIPRRPGQPSRTTYRPFRKKTEGQLHDRANRTGYETTRFDRHGRITADGWPVSTSPALTELDDPAIKQRQSQTPALDVDT